MSNHRNLAAVVAGYAASVVAYFQLPVPSWAGNETRVFIAFFLPTAAAAVALLMRNLLKRDPVLPGDELSAETRERIVSRLVLFIIALHTIMLWGLVDRVSWLSRGVWIAVGFTMIGVGNLLPRTRPNLVIGIPTAKALANRQEWIRLHRTIGRMTFGAGAGVMCGALLPAPQGTIEIFLLLGLAGALALSRARAHG